MNLRIPGPTPLPEAVRIAAGGDACDHRGERFEQLLRQCEARLKQFYQTESDVLVLTGSGTGGLEAALVNVLSPGQAVLAVSVGHFGERFAAVARAFGGQVTMLESEPGQALDARRVEAALARLPEPAVLLTTHNETSTGVLNDLEAVSQVLPGPGPRRPLWLVDGVSSLGATDLPMDRWGCDVVVSASQKAWMAPAGLAFLGVSERAWEWIDRARCPRYYWDLREARKYARKGQTPFTPAVNALAGLDAALELMVQEGLETIVQRHRDLARQTRAGLRALGFAMLASDQDASPTLTAARVPVGLSATEIKKRLLRDYGVAVAAGMGELKEQIIRVAHMGYCSEENISQLLAALKGLLPHLRNQRN
ncbi:MAG: Soluble hydrogenase 42 kDa subunit [Chloroflexi bacterium ADurb.Bin180]|nr:MAG: Soluble hydrogenase 42 kDa subunit [Chloroflexi bacterium ADurb.Bin180]